jgi:putative sterol carrier protein
MSDATTEFFTELGTREHEQLLNKVTGTFRFDLVDEKKTARWLVAVKRGHVDVSRGNGKADIVVRTEKALFDRVAAGELNAMAAVLRGEVSLEGDPRLLVSFQRLFPGPPGSREGGHEH